jgi:hypothetical protein
MGKHQKNSMSLIDLFDSNQATKDCLKVSEINQMKLQDNLKSEEL